MPELHVKTRHGRNRIRLTAWISLGGICGLVVAAIWAGIGMIFCVSDSYASGPTRRFGWEPFNWLVERTSTILGFEGSVAGPVMVFPVVFVFVCVIGFAVGASVPVMLRLSSELRRRYRRRIYPYLCRECSYDLRGSRGERCPECGAAIPAECAKALSRPTDEGGGNSEEG